MANNNVYMNGANRPGSFLSVDVSSTDSAAFSPSSTINVAVSGAVAVTDLDGNPVTLYFVAGYNHPCGCTKILHSGTAATGIVVGF